MSMLAVIPARGGSRRLPRKNVLDFAGRPLLAWTVVAARDSGLFTHVVVSTDDPEIAEAGRAAGAEVPFLRDRACDDHATATEATLRAIEQSEEHFGVDYGTVVQLMPNCPLRTADDIVDAVETFHAHDREFQVSVFAQPGINGWWALQLDENGMLQPLFERALTGRSQDLPPTYFPTGAVWVARKTKLKAAGTFYGAGAAGHPIGWRAATDIDTDEDLRWALALARIAAS
jgi:N-acylneuraminate cytidylyltransferase